MTMLLQDKNLGEILKEIRLSQKLTQNDLVAKVQLLGSNMSRATYSKIESGARNIKISDFILIKIALNVRYEDLLDKLRC